MAGEESIRGREEEQETRQAERSRVLLSHSAI